MVIEGVRNSWKVIEDLILTQDVNMCRIKGLILNALIPICPIDEMTFVFMNNDLFPIDSRG